LSVPAADGALPDLSLVPPWYAVGIAGRDPFGSLLSQGKETNNSFVEKVPTRLICLFYLKESRLRARNSLSGCILRANSHVKHFTSMVAYGARFTLNG